MEAFDLVIVGASFTGLLLASSLCDSDLRVLLLEKNSVTTNPNKRTTAISAGNMRFLREIGLQEENLEQAGKIRNIRIKEENSHYPINYEHREPMCHVFDNLYLLNLLRARVRNSNNITFLNDCSFSSIESDDFWTKIILDNEKEIQAKLLIAADGKFSPIREYFKLAYEKKHYNQQALVFNLLHEFEHLDNALELFTESGPLALLPTLDPHQSSVIWTLEDQEAKDYIDLSRESVADILASKINNYLGKLEIDSEIGRYDLSLTYFKDYFHRRILFLGDALHAIHPIAGQGLNLNIQDIRCLSKILLKHHPLGCDLGSFTILEKFKQQRRLANWRMIQLTDKLNGLYRIQSTPLRLLKNLGHFTIDSCDLLKSSIINFAMQIN